MKINDLRKSQSNGVPFMSLEVGQAYEDKLGNICIKTTVLYNNNTPNNIYYSPYSQTWLVGIETAQEKVIPLNIELNILP